MALGPLISDDEGDDALLSTINTTPLVDVMLVLLIIFLITIPVVTHTRHVQLPQDASQPVEPQPGAIHLTVNDQGQIFWDQTPVNLSDLTERLKKRLAGQGTPPAVHIRGDRRVPFAVLRKLLNICQSLGIHQVGFITEPPPRN